MEWVYFFLQRNKKRIKIGKTRNLARRKKNLSKTQLDVYELEFLVAVRGSGAHETAIQREFEEYAVEELKPASKASPEVFHAKPRLTNYVRWLRSQWFTVVDINENTDPVTYDEWKYEPGREKEPPSDPLFPLDHFEFPDPRLTTGDDFYTNPQVMDVARRMLGTIDLDPASHAIANKIVQAKKFFTVSDDGLKMQWTGTCWVNPPFSQWKLWVPKILEELHSGRVPEMLVYSAMRTVTTNYFHQLLQVASGMCIIKGRKKHGGLGTDSPDDGHCVFYMGKRIDDFVKAFDELGVTFKATTTNDRT